MVSQYYYQVANFYQNGYMKLVKNLKKEYLKGI